MERVPVISEIADVIDSRKGGDPKVSYHRSRDGRKRRRS